MSEPVRALPQLSAAVYALDGNELTLNEFKNVLGPLPSEVLQVVATVIGCRASNISDPSNKLRLARQFCSRAAAELRQYS